MASPDKIKAGIDRARAAGKHIGRPPSDREGIVEKMLLDGWKPNDIRDHLKIGTQVVRRVTKRLREQGMI